MVDYLKQFEQLSVIDTVCDVTVYTAAAAAAAAECSGLCGLISLSCDESLDADLTAACLAWLEWVHR